MLARARAQGKWPRERSRSALSDIADRSSALQQQQQPEQEQQSRAEQPLPIPEESSPIRRALPALFPKAVRVMLVSGLLLSLLSLARILSHMYIYLLQQQQQREPWAVLLVPRSPGRARMRRAGEQGRLGYMYIYIRGCARPCLHKCLDRIDTLLTRAWTADLFASFVRVRRSRGNEFFWTCLDFFSWEARELIIATRYYLENADGYQ